MNKLLLTLAAAGMLTTAATAQVSPLSMTAQRMVPSHRQITAKALQPNKALQFDASGMKQLHSLSLNRDLRIDDAKRSHKELSYQVNGDEATKCYTGQLQLNAVPGLTGYGFYQTYFQDMISRLKGNTISEIQFVAAEGSYRNVHVVILEADPVKGQVAVVWESETLNNIKTIQGKKINVNQIPCDYEITGEEKMLMIGWFAEQVSNPAMLNAVGYLDNTQQGYGFSFFGFVNGGLQLGQSIADAGWSIDGATTVTMASHIVVKTQGNSTIKDNDMMAVSSGVVRANVAGKGGDVQVSMTNMGLDPISSFEYQFECEGETKTNKFEFEKPMPFYSVGTFNLQAAVGKAAGAKEGKFTITKVNTVADEYADNKDNELGYPVVMMEKGYKRTPVVEEFTSNSCSACPFGAAAMKRLHDTYGDEIVLIAAHGNYQFEDPMYDAEYAKMGINSYPTALVNRQYQGHAYYDAVPTAEKIATSDVCEADMTIKVGAAPANKLVKTIDVTTTLNFDFDVKAGDYSMVYALTEDGITGVKQLTSLPSLVDQNMEKNPGYTRDQIIEAIAEGDPYLIEVLKEGEKDNRGLYWSEPTFNHVSRGVTNADGQHPDNLPAATKNTPIEVKAKVNIPATVKDRKNLKVVAMLIDNKTGVVVTGRQAAPSTTSTPSAIEEVGADAAQITVADGAFVVKANKAEAAVYSLDGKLVSSATVEGEASLPTFGKGVFVITVKADGKVYSQKATF